MIFNCISMMTNKQIHTHGKSWETMAVMMKNANLKKTIFIACILHLNKQSELGRQKL